MKPKGRTISLFLIAVFAAGILCCYFWTAEPHIMKVGKKHTELGDAEETDAACFWLTNDRLLRFSPRQDAYVGTMSGTQGTVVHQVQICTAYRLQRGMFERDAPLSSRLQKLDMAEILPQGDGRLLLWFPHNADPEGTLCDYARPHLYNLNTGKDVALPHLAESNSRSLLLLMDGDRLLRVKQLESVGYDTLFPLDIARRQILPVVKLPAYARLPSLMTPYWTDEQTAGASEGRLLLVDWYDRSEVSRSALFQLFRLQAQPSLERRYTVSLPTRSRILQVALSPQLTHVAWILETEYETPLDTMRRWLHQPSSGMMLSKQSLWVSRADGSDMHEIGRIDTAARPVPSLGDIHWLPDGNQVSLVIDRSLYTVAVK